VLWNELAQLHAQLGIAPPTATYGIKDLESEVALARRASASITSLPDYLTDAAALQQAAQQAGAVVEDAFGDPIPDGQQGAAHRRTHKTWRNFYGPLFFGERPTPTPNQSTLSEDESEGSRYAADQYSTRQR
jgi:hypothetical protein